MDCFDFANERDVCQIRLSKIQIENGEFLYQQQWCEGVKNKFSSIHIPVQLLRIAPEEQRQMMKNVNCNQQNVNRERSVCIIRQSERETRLKYDSALESRTDISKPLGISK